MRTLRQEKDLFLAQGHTGVISGWASPWPPPCATGNLVLLSLHWTTSPQLMEGSLLSLLKTRNTKPLGSLSDPQADTDENVSTLDIHGNFAECSKVLLMGLHTKHTMYCIVMECQ